MSNNKQSSVEKEFVPYQEALALKELGFDEPCFAWYNDNGNYMLGIDEVRFDTKNTYHFNNTDSVSAPLYQQAFRWFREKYKLKYCIIPLVCEQGYSDLYESRIHQEKHSISRIGSYKTYEEAELACLRKLIEIQGGNNKQQ